MRARIRAGMAWLVSLLMTFALVPAAALADEGTTGYGDTIAIGDYTYKVAVVSISGQWEDDPDYVRSFCTIIGCGNKEGGVYAPQNLNVRAIKQGTRNLMETAYGQVEGYDTDNDVSVKAIDWNKVEDSGNDTMFGTHDHIQNAALHIPMFTSGATITFARNTKSTELGEIQPLYQLASVRLVNSSDAEYEMLEGDTLNMANIQVQGYDGGGVEYYGFDASDGKWILCDENGTEIGTSDVVNLKVNATTGSVKLSAKKAGTAYLTWVLKDDASYQAKYGEEVTSQNPPKKSPIIEVTVNAKPESLEGYHIEVEGEPTVFANKNLDPNTALQATVYDGTDAVVTHQVVYKLQDATAPADITNNVFTATETGDYQVRATYTVGDQTIRSGWLTVHVHSLIKTDAAEATCTEDGNIDYWTDDQTGDLYADEDGTTSITKEEVVKTALGHDLEHVDAAEATCTKGGNIEHYLCKRCGKFFADEQAATELGEGDVIFTEALGHDWDEGVVDPGAGCVTTGTRTYTCRREGCGITKAEEVAALGHDWSDWIESRPATDIEDGEEKRMCIYCSAEETRTIPADSHVHDLSQVDAAAPTCTTDGNVDYWLCSRCNNIYADDAAQTQINKGDEVVSATGHAWDEGTVTTDPTCTGTGIRALKCTNQGCDETKDVDEPAHGHDMQNVIESVITEPTCTTAGRKKLACAYKDSEGCTYYKTEAIDALGHAWDEGKVTTKPTCTTKGKKTFTCTHEGCSATQTEGIGALGHKWGKWTKLDATQHKRVCANDKSHTQRANHKWDAGVVTKKATVKANGTKTYTCADCGATKTVSIPKVKVAGTLLSTATATGNTALTIKWNKIPAASGYVVYLAQCNNKGKKYDLEIVEFVEFDENNSTIKTTIKDLKKSTCYRVVVKAFVNVGGEKVFVKSAPMVHAFTTNGTSTKTNPKSVKVEKTEVTLKKGKSTQIKASVVKLDSKKKLIIEEHCPALRYRSNNTKVATVSTSGRILAQGKGTCKVYVLAPNGVKKAVTVTVS